MATLSTGFGVCLDATGHSFRDFIETALVSCRVSTPLLLPPTALSLSNGFYLACAAIALHLLAGAVQASVLAVAVARSCSCTTATLRLAPRRVSESIYCLRSSADCPVAATADHRATSFQSHDSQRTYFAPADHTTPSLFMHIW
jgi:hypothetical protein